MREQIEALRDELRNAQRLSNANAAYHRERLAEKPRSGVVRCNFRMAQERHSLLREIADNLDVILSSEDPK